jgi:LPS-assembly protein
MATRLLTAWVFVCLGALTFLLIAGRNGVAQQQPCGARDEAERQRVVLRAETLEYARLEQRLVATGNVSLIYGELRVFADRVELDPESGIGVASGYVRLRTPEDSMEAARLDFELTSERGVLYNSSGIVAQSYVVAGERIERLGPRALLVHKGRLTTCTAPVPDWEFRAREARIGLGEYVTLKDPSFWVRGVPVFYVPYAILPLKDKRTTGFLPPKVGASRRDGAVIGTEFFWAMTDWIDTTLGLEYLSEKGWRPEGEFRYAIDPLSDGQVQGSFIHEQDTGEERWKVFVQQRQEFGWGVRGLSQLDLRSRRDLDRRFARDIALESVVHTASFGTLTKSFADSTLTLTGEAFEGIVESGSAQAFHRLPRLHFMQFPTSVLGGAFWAVETSYSRLSATGVRQDTPVQRLDFFPHLTVPLSLPPWGQLTVTGGIRETFYDHQRVGEAGISRELFDLQAYLQGPALRRRYNGTAEGRAMLHLIETQVAYRYVPRVQQDDLPPFETLNAAQHFLDPLETLTLVDRMTAAHYAKITLVNRLFAMYGGQPERPGVREVVRLVLSQGFDMREGTAGSGPPLGPLDVELEMRFWQRWWFSSTLRLVPDTGDLQEANGRLGVTIHPDWLVYVASRYRQAPDIRYISGGMQVLLREGLLIGYDWRYDDRFGAFREHQTTLRYRTQCWSVDLRFRWRERGDTEFSIRAGLWQF